MNKITEKNSRIKDKSDSLIELLTAQCVDLENLLALAREETFAAKQSNFAKIIDIYSERSELNDRLETFQKQVTELRETFDKSIPFEIADRIKETVNLTLAQDKKTKLLLTTSRREAVTKLNNLGVSKKNAGIYLYEDKKGLAFDKKL